MKIKNIFPVLFLAVLIADICIKTMYDDISSIRFVSKISLSVLLITYYMLYHRESVVIKKLFMLLALSFFLIGDVFFVLYKIELYYIYGIFSFAIGKLFYVFRFSNQEDFKLRQLLPVIVFCFGIMMLIFQLIYDNLNNFFFPVLIYLFAVALFIIFAFLRKNLVNKKSFYLVSIGVFLSIFSDSISALNSFTSNDIPFHEIGVMLFYGLSQLLIVMGIVEENVLHENQTEGIQ